MIIFKEISKEEPYLTLNNIYERAIGKDEKNIDVLSISSFNKEKDEVESRLVNLKYIIKKEFIFFSNYNSPKSIAFETHNQISALLFWPSINFQIRMKAIVKKTSKNFNHEYFQKRASHKNALSISSKQSNIISSYKQVIRNYNQTKKFEDLSQCPEYWGGFSFIPYYFEFWEGHESRINKRNVFNKINGHWSQFILEP